MNRLLTAAMTLLLLGSPVRADDELKRAEAIVETFIQGTLDTLKDETTSVEDKKKLVMAEIEPFFDLKLIAKLVLGRRNWPKFSKTERVEFTGLFMKQLQNSYFDKVELLTDEKVGVDKAVRKKKKIHVYTFILAKSERYELIYKLYSKKGRLRVYDVEIEGISLVKSYGSQYDQFLQKSTPRKLLAKMKEKVFEPPKAFEKAKTTKKKEKKKDG